DSGAGDIATIPPATDMPSLTVAMPPLTEAQLQDSFPPPVDEAEPRVATPVGGSAGTGASGSAAGGASGAGSTSRPIDTSASAPVVLNRASSGGTGTRLDAVDRLIGQTIAEKYLIEQRLGETATAVVYRARQL